MALVLCSRRRHTIIPSTFEIEVLDVFTITGLGTVFLGNVESGSITVGEPAVCRTRSADIPLRVISLQDSSGKKIERGEPGALIGVVCKQIDLAKLSDSFMGEGSERKPSGIRLVPGPEKKHWWS